MNICLMAKDNKGESDESVEVTMECLLTFTKEYLAHGLLKYFQYEQDHISKIKALKKKTSS